MPLLLLHPTASYHDRKGKALAKPKESGPHWPYPFFINNQISERRGTAPFT